MSKQMKHERLEKMIRDELEEIPIERQMPIQGILHKTRTPGSGH